MSSSKTNPLEGETVGRLPRLRTEQQRLEDLYRKVDNRIPDEVWMVLQECGELAAMHLHNIMSGPRFEKLKIHEQIRLIELSLLRAYGSAEAAWIMPVNPPRRGNAEDGEANPRNAIADLANVAAFPEFRTKEKT